MRTINRYSKHVRRARTYAMTAIAQDLHAYGLAWKIVSPLARKARLAKEWAIRDKAAVRAIAYLAQWASEHLTRKAAVAEVLLVELAQAAAAGTGDSNEADALREHYRDILPLPEGSVSAIKKLTHDLDHLFRDDLPPVDLSKLASFWDAMGFHVAAQAFRQSPKNVPKT